MGLNDISYANIEQLFLPHMTGQLSMIKTRNQLIASGLSQNFVDMIAAKYIQKMETGKIVTIMDLFEGKVKDFNLKNIYMNYTTMHDYQSELLNNNTQHSSRVTPVRPVGLRGFSTEKSKFMDYIEKAEKIEE
jgi:hypothetical protein